VTAATLRTMRWWDVASAHALEQELFSDAWTESMFWSELAGVPATRYYVVAARPDHDDVVGYAGLYAAGSDADVQTIAVAPGEQGTGLGTLLLDDLLAQARERGCARVTLEVREDNSRAQELYARRGFERIGVRRGYYPADGADAIVMQLRLRGGAPVRIGVA
jgi:[ribosomal protein S18]-alanine N-acetyltransferase